MNATPPPGRDPEQLERSAEQIRADLDRTLDALERKLSPSQLLDRSLAYLRDHGGDMMRAVGETVQRHPVPILLTVAGLGLLVASSLRPRHRVDDRFGDESPYADAHYADARRSRFKEGFDAARERTRAAQDQMVSVVEERPILLGGLAVVIGALLGAVIPSSRYEDRTVGQIRDRAVERAKRMGERQYQNLRSRLETHQDLEVSGQAH
jgi:ElaB/YqjD/DUF883 family membrane-anchored ribosome-binding protein